MNLSVDVQSDAVIVTNVQNVAKFYLGELQKYVGCVASAETLKDDKKKCTDINKLKKFVSEQRIAFDKEVNSQPDVKAVHDALKSIEDMCDAVRNPYWESCKAIEDANKPAEELYDATINLNGVTMKQFEKVKKALVKDGIDFKVAEMNFKK